MIQCCMSARSSIPLGELLKRRLVFYESRERRKPVRMGLNKRGILRAAAETDKRLNAYAAAEYAALGGN